MNVAHCYMYIVVFESRANGARAVIKSDAYDSVCVPFGSAFREIAIKIMHIHMHAHAAVLDLHCVTNAH